jgi:prepilin peptidase CpaA
MQHLHAGTIVLIVVVGTYTLLAAIQDIRFRRIPNWLTVTALLLGLVYQLGFYGVSGLIDAGSGFALGFGTLFVLWLMGGGGAGDVKLLGALGVWLGFRGTFQVIVLSTVLVAILQLGRVIVGLARNVTRSRTERASSCEVATDSQTQPVERTVAYAVPVAVATWVVGALVVLKSIAAASANGL